ncbi:cytochrome c3 family protein [Azospirillum sp.]|uniref:cytochrome c3 family protein n=1 Tax=Azospirillum sp. TaxID=34012 RepID=UPI003D730FCE
MPILTSDAAQGIRRLSRGLFALVLLLLAALASMALPSDAMAQTTGSNIRQTKHNLSKNAPAGNTVRSTDVDQVCVFCHTPHAATKDAQGAAAGPLWNRKLSTQTYTPYSSSSLDATGLGQPGGSSKLCLSCHDGTLAIGQISVLNGKPNQTATMQGTSTCADGSAGCMPVGSGATSGYTRRLGTDLTNDHPISFTYDDALATRDGELRTPTQSGGAPRLIDSRAIGYRPTLPLENGQMQCTTCHDPHLYDPADANRKFLRLNRTQKNAPPSGTTFNVTNDIICLACHTKEGYAESAHANSTSAIEQYTDAAADARGFPRGTKVWQASCLNCHDTHTIQGARRLLRGGADGAGNAKSEEVCYTCHSASGNTVLTTVTEVPNVRTDFEMGAPGSHMPINTGGTEAHDIGTGAALSGKDGIETQARLGDRHVECADCHNPHRVRKAKQFDGSSSTGTAGTHTHDDTGSTAHSNIISGALRGSWGVEPTYGGTLTNAFGNNPTGFTVKRGDPGVSIATDVDQTYVTREYQICLKCHSNYAYGTNPPILGSSSGGTTQYFTQSENGGTWTGSTLYTNQAMEFQGPTNDKGEQTGTGGVTNNHRSWHPVMTPTGRDVTTRNSMSANTWLGPFSKAVGTQTMYCTDCHGNSVTTAGTVKPEGNTGTNENGNPWGPHGSGNKFILKAPFSDNTGSGATNDLCFHCHKAADYTSANASVRSGFWDNNTGKGNLHAYHNDRIANVNSGNTSKFRCTYCHVGVPHGWKNKALLANLNDVGPEVGLAAGTSVSFSGKRYYRAPYYMGAILRVRNWKKSGQWADTDCGPTSGTYGKDWMKSACANIP